MESFEWSDWVLGVTGASEITGQVVVQSLWGGCGELLRLRLRGGPVDSVILKRVVPLGESYADRRKRRSYEVEQHFYQHVAARCDDLCRVARWLGSLQRDGFSLLLLEDLREDGFAPHRGVGATQIRAGLDWLAHFHARFLGVPSEGLWEQGSYWHLQTRPEEWQRMPAGPLKQLAAALDQCMRGVRFVTLVHGDSKPANFLWNADGVAAAVDFQYVGRGCGIRDVAYFLDGCLRDDGCEAEAENWLDFYFGVLRSALGRPAHDLEEEWRALFPVAWADYCRFYLGWGRRSELGAYSQKQMQRAATFVESSRVANEERLGLPGGPGGAGMA